MSGPWFLSSLLLWAGATLLLAERPWARRRPLTDRLGPYLPGAWTHLGVGAPPSAGDALAAGLEAAADAVVRRFDAIGDEGLARRLERVHSSRSASEVRSQQVALGATSLAGTALGAVAVGCPAALAAAVAVIAPLLAIAGVEARIARTSRRWQRQLELELPTVCEHLAMLLGAGRSLGSALAELAERGRGAAARDLRRVVHRSQQGLGDQRALAEWRALAGVAAVDHLVAILALDQHTGHLGRLIDDEARSQRAHLRRAHAADLRRRGQQVWVPVTIATLVPGALLLAVPFLAALHAFAAS